MVEMDPVPLDVVGLGNYVLARREGREYDAVPDDVDCMGASHAHGTLPAIMMGH